jgi:F-box/leucine-rich repeat protein 7
VGIFAHCDRAILDKIASMMTKASYKAGQTIIQHNSHADEMFFLVHGQVVISSEFGEKIAEDREGSYFGEVGILNNIPRIACVKAKTDCITYVLTRAALLESLEKYPDVMLEVKRESEARLQNYLMRSILA